MPHGGAYERVQMTNLRNTKTITAHKLMYFIGSVIARIAFLQLAKSAAFSRTVYILSVISRSQVETMCKHVGVELCTTVRQFLPSRFR